MRRLPDRSLLLALLSLAGFYVALTMPLLLSREWLTVSWASDPYYYGNDLPYLMAWLPLILAGSPMFSVDAAIRSRRRQRSAEYR